MDAPSNRHRIIWISPGTTLGHAYALMREHPIRHLPVLEGKRVVGLVSDRDLLLYASPVADGQLNFPSLPVSKIMSTELVTCRPTATLGQLAELMLKNKIGALPVTAEDGMFLGLVTSSDLLQVLSSSADSRLLPFRFDGLPITH